MSASFDICVWVHYGCLQPVPILCHFFSQMISRDSHLSIEDGPLQILDFFCPLLHPHFFFGLYYSIVLGDSKANSIQLD